MLSGFDYPIEQLQFSVNLPGTTTQNPSFLSGYHQADIEKDLTYSISGGNIAGRSWTTLKDHETLTMYLDVTEEMFPQSRADLPEVEDVTRLIGICAAVAAVFWLLFLRNWLPIREYPAVAPEGFGAGQLGTVLTKAGADGFPGRRCSGSLPPWQDFCPAPVSGFCWAICWITAGCSCCSFPP